MQSIHRHIVHQKWLGYGPAEFVHHGNRLQNDSTKNMGTNDQFKTEAKWRAVPICRWLTWVNWKFQEIHFFNETLLLVVTSKTHHFRNKWSDQVQSWGFSDSTHEAFPDRHVDLSLRGSKWYAKKTSAVPYNVRPPSYKLVFKPR